MTTTIKITELTDIGANLASSTVLPVVNMSGTPTTQKTVLGNIANVILEGAGTDYSPVGEATLAGTVTTNAQPNITSVGSLTGLTVSNSSGVVNFSNTANVTLGAIGNLHISGGTAGQLLSTNGNGTLSWASDTTTYGNSNVANYLPTYTGNVGANWVIADYFSGNAHNLTYIPGANINGAVAYATTANSVAAANVSGLGNVALINKDGNASNVLYGNGVFAPVTGGDVQSKIANGTSNVTITPSNGPVVINVNGTEAWTFSDSGNLQTAGDIVGPAGANLTIYANAGVHEFTFGDDGTFYAPDNVVLGGNAIYIGPGANTLTGVEHEVLLASSNNFAYVQGVINNVSDNGSAEWVALGAKGNDAGGWAEVGFTSSGFGDANYTITGAGDGYVFAQSYAPGQTLLGGGGNLILATGNQGSVKDIIFGTGGFLTSNIFGRISDANNALELSRTNSNINLVGGGGIIGAGNLYLYPDTNNTGSYLDIFLTSGPDLHLVASAAANLILGKDAGPNVMTSWDGNVYVQSWNTGSNTQGGVWNFDQGGNLTAPGAINVGNMSIGALPGYITANNNTAIILNTSGSDGGFVVDYLKEDGNANTSGGELAFSSELGNATYRISLSDDMGDGFATKIWRFDGTGNLTLPGNTFAVNYANGTQVSLGGGSYGDSNVVSLLSAFGSNTITTTGNVSVGNIIGNGQSLTGIAGSNVTGQVSNSLVAGTVYTAAQPNITSVGTLTSLTVSGNVTAQGVGTNLVRRANTISGSNTVVTLDNLTALVGGTPTRLFIGAATSNMTMAGTSQTMISGSIAVSSWINVPIVTGVGNGFAMSGAISSAGDTVVLNVTDQGAGSGTWRVTGMIANTSANLYSVSIERLA